MGECLVYPAARVAGLGFAGEFLFHAAHSRAKCLAPGGCHRRTFRLFD